MFMFTYHCKLGGATKQLEVDQARLDDYFTLIGFMTDLDRPAAESILHAGHPIIHPRARFWAVARVTGTGIGKVPRLC